jgi:phage-related protein
MSDQFIRKTSVYGTEFWEFYNSQKKQVQDKIDWVIGLVRTLQIIPEKYFKHLEGTAGLYEIRIKLGNNIYRVFCFFDEGKLIILLNGFQKKTDKTPKQEIERAERLKARYYEDKAKNK